MLEEQRRSGARPRSLLSIEETRDAVLAGRRWQGAPLDVPTRDTSANGVPVRLYGRESATALVFFHGGRFFSGNLDSHDAPLRLLAHLSGIQICAVDYRLAPEHSHPAAMDDAITAARWLAPQTSRLHIGGDSAGGYLAAATALAVPAAAQMLIYPMLDPACDTPSYQEFWRGPWPSGEDMRRGWQLYGGPAIRPDAGLFPATLLITAGIDPLRDEALSFAGSLRAQGVTVTAHHFADMTHGFFTQTLLTRSQELMRLLAASLSPQ